MLQRGLEIFILLHVVSAMQGRPGNNIAEALERQAAELGDRPAVHEPSGDGFRHIGFRSLNGYGDRLAAGMRQTGILPGMRVLVMVTPGIDFIAATFALFKTGAVPVLIDPGLGRESLLRGIEEAEPEAMIGVPRAHLARLVFRTAFRSVRILVTAGRRWFWGGITLAGLDRLGQDARPTPPSTRADDPAAILFTSGSTGPAKGVVYTHAMFLSQVEAIRSRYGILPGKDVELSAFPLFALFAVGMGMSTVIPRMDASRPAEADPENILAAVERFAVTSSFGSPALWNTVTRHCLNRGIRLPTLQRILMAGAPVSGELIRRFDSILAPSAKIHTPYGATECLPVADIERREILGETWERSRNGEGVCVGNPLPGVRVNIIRITDDPLPDWSGAEELGAGEIGEIAVHCPWMTREYFRREAAARAAKIRRNGELWHRMGDIGWMDAQGRLWFCGRKTQRVVTDGGVLFTIPCESIFNRHPDVFRSALVGVGERPHQRPAIVIELEKGRIPQPADEKTLDRLRRELLQQAQTSPLTRDIRDILFHPSFPVDIRHNAKIFREKLAEWAKGQLR